jgi:hypothetical protein
MEIPDPRPGRIEAIGILRLRKCLRTAQGLCSAQNAKAYGGVVKRKIYFAAFHALNMASSKLWELPS